MPLTRRRTVISLSLGAKIGLVVALLLVLWSAYQYWSPVDLTGTGGAQFRCGSGAHPPSGVFGSSTCGSLADRQQMRAAYGLGAAFVIALGALYAFGLDRRYVEIREYSVQPDGAPAARPVSEDSVAAGPSEGETVGEPPENVEDGDRGLPDPGAPDAASVAEPTDPRP